MHFPAPTTDLDGLHELLASTQSVTQRWLDKAKTKDEPPSIADISNLTLATRRIALLHRDIYRLENPGLAFPSSKKSSSTKSNDPVDPSDPVILSEHSSSEFCNSEFAIGNSAPIPTYPREISRYVAACIVKSIKSKPEDAADCCPDLYEEMDLMKSNPAYHAETLSEFRSSTAAPDPADPVILSENIPSENSVISVPPCETSVSSSDFRNSTFAIRNLSDPPDPVILSNDSSSAISAPLRENSSAVSSSSFSNSTFAIRNFPPARAAPRIRHP